MINLPDMDERKRIGKRGRAGLAFGLLIALFVGLSSFLPKDKHKGTLYSEVTFSGVESTKGGCVLDSGEAYVMMISRDHENPLFESREPNRVHFQLLFQEAPTPGERIHLPREGVQLCYWEKGDLLMFKTSKPQGWIKFDNSFEEKTVTGELDLKLVKPHHNMSNSDYHYMGGTFKLKARPFAR